MADPFDAPLSKAVHDAISRPGVLEGEDVTAHSAGTVICIGKSCRYPTYLRLLERERERERKMDACLKHFT